MPTSLDSSIRPAVANLIARVGQAATLEAPRGEAAYNPSTGGYEAAPATAAASVTATPPTPVSVRRIDGTVVKADDSTSFLSAKSLEDAGVAAPEVGGYLVLVDGERRSIVRVDKLYSGEQVAAYEVYLRG